MLSYVPASGWPPNMALPAQPSQPPALQKSNSTKTDKNITNRTKDYKVPMAVKMKQFINPSETPKTSAKNPSNSATNISSSIRRRSSMKWRSFRNKRPFLEAVSDKREPLTTTNGVMAYCEDNNDDVISGKDRLLAILAVEKVALAERALQQASVASTASNTINTTSLRGSRTVGESCSSSCSTISSEAIEAATNRNNKNVFHRGVFSSLRRSFRKAVKPSTATSSTTTSKKMFSSINNPDFSHDSGLGDDSDTSHRTSPALKFNSLSSSGMLHAKGPPTHLLFLHPEIGIHIFLNKCIILTCRN